jgi:transcriptional regulator with XRE-family HTH domain
MAFFIGGDMNRLREIRVVKRITQFQLRLITGIHQSKISLIENGFIEPQDEEKEKLAKALGVSLEEIFPANVSSIPFKEQSYAVGAR